jgi:PilZ domain-containing protein
LLGMSKLRPIHKKLAVEWSAETLKWTFSGGAPMAEVERRKKRRFSTSLPVTLLNATEQSEIPGITRDVSAAGTYVYIEADEFPQSVSLECILLLPREMTFAEPSSIRCKARVVRVDARESGGIGVALRINSYEFLRSGSESRMT